MSGPGRADDARDVQGVLTALTAQLEAAIHELTTVTSTIRPRRHEPHPAARW